MIEFSFLGIGTELFEYLKQKSWNLWQFWSMLNQIFSSTNFDLKLPAFLIKFLNFFCLCHINNGFKSVNIEVVCFLWILRHKEPMLGYLPPHQRTERLPFGTSLPTEWNKCKYNIWRKYFFSLMFSFYQILFNLKIHQQYMDKQIIEPQIFWNLHTKHAHYFITINSLL